MKKINIGLLTFPISKAGIIPTSNLLEILISISNDIYLVTGGEGYDFFKKDNRFRVYDINHKKGKNNLIRVIRYIYTQIKISIKIIKISKKIDLWIFFIGGSTLILPMFIVKLLGKKVILASASSTLQSFRSAKDTMSIPVKILEEFNYLFADVIILHSKNLIQDWNLEKFREKIKFAHEYFLDSKKFYIQKNLNDRENLIGYIGRFSEEKGIFNFIQAIQYIIKKRTDVKFLIIGEGYLKDKIQEYINKNNLNEYVKLISWVPHEELPKYLNELKLLVIPSYTESGPIIAFEAMACGTPILGTRVGQILNMINDEKTGFIMESNLPECIAENVNRILSFKNLDNIVKDGRTFVEKEFTYTIAVKTYRQLLKDILE
jgi:glycosyltransferase involved in cell wall biosynthesis